ncbi:hypothetical protein BpHYR1_009707 [Brachionus plicatilis]|uniref:Uncharacterized protein n=1 Tax=Brachionus plicatilis TaxID=10195 RepID=A0A3M7P0P2_BRAPC|nr:hypothetical protein BpHYR1_009707 [Brachionus plicatilis]
MNIECRGDRIQLHKIQHGYDNVCLIKGWRLMGSTVQQGTPELVILQLSASWFATARHAPTSTRTGLQVIGMPSMQRPDASLTLTHLKTELINNWVSTR